MRLLPLLLVLAACGPDPATPDAPPPLPLPPGRVVETDSLLRDEPARTYRVAIGYPQIRATDGEPLPVALQAANAAVRDTVAAFADDLRPEAPPPGADPPDYPVEADGRTDRVWLSDDVFSTLVEVYVYTGGAHGATYFVPITVDLATGAPVAPADLFDAGTPWADTLAAHVGRGIRSRIRPTDVFATDGLDNIREGRVDLTLSPDSLTVYVPAGQVSSFAAGSFHIAVPRAAVEAFVRPGGLLARDR